MDAVAKNRLSWKCRRGLLELDLVLQRYLLNFQEEDLEPFDQLLELPDNDLWDIVIGRSNDFPPHLNEVVARLRAA